MRPCGAAIAALMTVALSTAPAKAGLAVVGGSEHYRSGEATVEVEWFAPKAKPKAKKRPVVIVLHGSGGLGPEGPSPFRSMAREMAGRGYVVLTPHLFDRTGHRVGEPLQPEDFHAHLDAVKGAIDVATARDDVDGERIGLFGFSMGAGLALTLGGGDERIRALAILSAQPPSADRSPGKPTIVLVGSKDPGVAVHVVKAFEEGMKTRGLPCASHVYVGMGHNPDAPRFADAGRRVGTFFNTHLKTTVAP